MIDDACNQVICRPSVPPCGGVAGHMATKIGKGCHGLQLAAAAKGFAHC